MICARGSAHIEQIPRASPLSSTGCEYTRLWEYTTLVAAVRAARVQRRCGVGLGPEIGEIRRGRDGPGPGPLSGQRNCSQGVYGSTCVRRNSGAAAGDTMNRIISRAASGSFEADNTATLDWQGLFNAPGTGPT